MKRVFILDRSLHQHFGIEEVLVVCLDTFAVGCWPNLGTALNSSVTDPDLVIIAEENGDEFEAATRVIGWHEVCVVCLVHQSDQRVHRNGRIHRCDMSGLNDVLRLVQSSRPLTPATRSDMMARSG